jgi:hypothetical protein
MERNTISSHKIKFILKKFIIKRLLKNPSPYLKMVIKRYNYYTCKILKRGKLLMSRDSKHWAIKKYMRRLYDVLAIFLLCILMTIHIWSQGFAKTYICNNTFHLNLQNVLYVYLNKRWLSKCRLCRPIFCNAQQNCTTRGPRLEDRFFLS